MNTDLEMQDLQAIICRHRKAGVVRTKSHSVFICPLEGGGLRFLHKIFDVRAEDRREELQRLLRFSPPVDYSDFMSRCNGATLFDNTFSIYGIGFIVSRSLDIEDQHPILLRSEIESADALYGASYPWRRIGSVAAYNMIFELEICQSGQARMRSPHGTVRNFLSFMEMILDLARLLDKFVDESGFNEVNQREMDAVFLDFIKELP